MKRPSLAINRYGDAQQQCYGKTAYHARKIAYLVARRYGLTVYRCKLDKRHWHVTSRRYREE